MQQEPADIETQIATLNLLDVKGIDWERVQHTAYLIHQHFRYDYPGPVLDLKQRLLIVPPETYGDQKCIVHRLNVSADIAEDIIEIDEFENRVINLHIPSIESSIDFEAWIVVERFTDQIPRILPGTILLDPRFLLPSALTQPDDTLRSVAVNLCGDEQVRWHAEALTWRINDWVHNAIRYEHGITDIHTTAGQALSLGGGVCQDYAHVMLTLCRLCGLPARYVSGHLLGEGGTHAWVEVLLPAHDQQRKAVALAVDPTHGCETDLHYITIAVGRDYYDVAPTSGTYRAPYQGQLTTSKRVGPISLKYADVETDSNTE